MRHPLFSLAYGFACLFILIFSIPSAAQWSAAASPGGELVYQVLYADNAWVSMTESGVYRSTDDGRSWQSSFPLIQSYSNRLSYRAADHTLWLLSKEQGVHYSADGGINWQALPTIDFGEQYPDEPMVTDDFLFYRSYNRIYRIDLANPGPGELVFQGMINPSLGISIKLAVRGNDLWVSSSDSLLRSSDGGNSWLLIHQQTTINTFDVHDDVLMVHATNGMQRSTDYGANWQSITSVPASGLLKWSDGVWFAGQYNEPLRYSTDNGLNWQVCSAGLASNYTIFAAEKNGLTFLLNVTGYGLTRSGDLGATWQICTTGMAFNEWSTDPFFETTPIYEVGDYLVVDQYFSNDGGDIWIKPLVSNAGYNTFNSTIIYYNNSYFVVGYNRQLHRSTGDMEHWETTGSPFAQNTGHQLLSVDGHFYRIQSVTNSILSIYETTDNGVTWTLNGSFTNAASPVVGLHNQLFYWAGTLGLFRSGDGGATWQSVGAGLGDFLSGSSGFFQQTKLLAAGDLLFVYSDYGIMASTNDGLTFTKINTNLLSPAGYPMGTEQLASDGTNVAVVIGGSIYYSIGLNDQWVEITANLSANSYSANLTFHNDSLYLNTGYQPQPIWRRALSSINIVQISGRVWRDDNNNGQIDAGEPPYAGVIVQAGSGSFATSAADGIYTWLADLDNDTLRVHLPVPWATSNPGFYQVNTSINGRDFGIYFPPNVTDLSIRQTNTSVFRPGFNEQIYLNYHNKGTAVADGTLRFLAASPLEFVSANFMPDVTIGDTLIWNLHGLAPFSEGQIIVTVHTPVSVPVFTTVSTWAAITPISADANPADNEDILQEIVVGSYDPNDKRSDHAQISPDQLAAGEPITYTVRFQNTGTYPADFVRITDTLDAEHLDVASFRVLASSHACQTTLSGTGNLEFLFANIALPPSDFDEAASHGFVQYTVRPKANLPLHTNITNTAFIYFDFNSPIITNTTETIVAVPVAVHETAAIGKLQLRPNPAHDYVEIMLDQNETGQLRIINTFGQVVLNQQWTGEKTRLELSGLAAGFYTIEWQNTSNGSRRIGKLIKQ